MGSVRKGWDQLALEGFLTEAQTLAGLIGAPIENWVVLHKNKFDVHANNEPHVAQTLFMDKSSGRYLHKVFGRTIEDGCLSSPSELQELTRKIFKHSRVCQGLPDNVKVEPGITLAPGFHPYPRKVDPLCQLLFKDLNPQATVCPNCTRALQPEVDPLAEVISNSDGTASNSNSDEEESERHESMDDYSDIDIDDPDVALWPDPSKTIKYAPSDYSSVDEDGIEDGITSNDVNILPSEGMSILKKSNENVDPDVGLAYLKKSARKDLSPSVPVITDAKPSASTNKLHCNHCNKTFTNALNYRDHRAKLRRSEGKIPCKYCRRAHYSFDSLAKHLSNKHKKVPISLKKYLQSPQDIKAMKQERVCSTCKIVCNGNHMLHRHRALFHELGDYKCTDCNQYQLTYYHMVLHNYNHHSRILPFLEPSTDGLEKLAHVDGSVELVRKLHVCPQCPKVFKYDGEWVSHMKVHHAWSLFTCDHCEELCHYLQDFKAHVNNFHSGNPQIKCPKCAEVFSLKDDPECFDAHFNKCVGIATGGDQESTIQRKQSMSTNGNVSQCDQCWKNRVMKPLFEGHLKSSGGLDLFHCEKCGCRIGDEYENNESLDGFPDINMDDPDLTLWPEQKPNKKIKYPESDYNSEDEDEIEDGITSNDVNILPSKGVSTLKTSDENVDSVVGLANQKDNGKKVDAPSVPATTDKKQPTTTESLHCNHCNKTFSKAINYRNHRAMLRRPEWNIPCKYCRRAHFSFDSLAKHLITNHNQMPIALRSYLQTPQDIKAMKHGRNCSTCKIVCNGNLMVHRHRALFHELGDYKCTECDHYQLTYYHLVLHNYNHHSRILPFLEPSTDGLEKLAHVDGSVELVRKLHPCPQCPKVFKYDGEWGRHMKVQHAWSVFTCELCEELCHYLQDFKAHVNNFHSGNPQVKCPKCAEVFSLKDDPECFDAHFNKCVRIVAGEDEVGDIKMKSYKRPNGNLFQCDKCGKNYATKYLFQGHLKSHAGVNRFHCAKCDYRTNVKNSMFDHKNSHLRAEGKTQDENGTNLYMYCDRCPKKFVKRNWLKRHIQEAHEGIKRKFNCTDCDATFNSSSMLYGHKRRSHGFVAVEWGTGRWSRSKGKFGFEPSLPSAGASSN